jgi:hypothetical protein
MAALGRSRAAAERALKGTFRDRAHRLGNGRLGADAREVGRPRHRLRARRTARRGLHHCRGHPVGGGSRTSTSTTAGAARWPRWLPRCSASVGGFIGMPRGTYGVDGSWTRRTRTGPLLQPWPCGRYWRPNGSGHSRFVRHFTTTSTPSSRRRRRPTPMTSTTRRVPLWLLNGHRSLRCWLTPDHDWTT